MGSSQSQPTYSIAVNPAQLDESQTFQNFNNPGALTEGPNGCNSLTKVLVESFKKHSERNCYTNTAIIKKQLDQSVNYQKSLNFKQVFEESQRLGSGIKNKGIFYQASKEFRNYVINFTGIMYIANILYGFTMVPIAETIDVVSLEAILHLTGINSLFISQVASKNILCLSEKHNLKTLILLEEFPLEVQKMLQDKGFELLTYQQVIDSGDKQKHNIIESSQDDFFSLSFTSGTTGVPKGVMINNFGMCSTINALISSQLQINLDDCHLSFLPLSHIFERIVMFTFLVQGGEVCFYSGDILKIREDWCLFKPTVIAIVPRLLTRFTIYYRIYSLVNENFDKLPKLKKSLAKKGVSAKLKNYHNNGTTRSYFWDTLLFHKTQALFGGRCRIMVTGSAPISSDILDFMKIVACCPILEGYGQTETLGASFVTAINDNSSGHVGGPLQQVAFKLLDCPEMNYTHNDRDEKGNSMPRGEVAIKSNGNMVAYYKNEKSTKETMTQDGFVHTGDIGILLPNGSIKLIDRRKNLFKLSQGEYVAPEKIEGTLTSCPGVSEIFVYGDPLRYFLVAIVVVDHAAVQQVARELGIEGSVAELCTNERINQAFFKRLDDFGKKNLLNGLERIKKVYLEKESFVLKGLCTSTFKVQRSKCKDYYKDIIEKLYQE